MNTRIRQLKSGSWVAEVEKTKLFFFKKWYAITKCGGVQKYDASWSIRDDCVEAKEEYAKRNLAVFMIEMGFNAY